MTANFLDIRDNTGRTPLIYAVLSGREDTVRDLLGRGAALDIKDNEGMTALDIAAKLERSAMVQMIRDEDLRRNPPPALELPTAEEIEEEIRNEIFSGVDEEIHLPKRPDHAGAAKPRSPKKKFR